LKLAVLLLERAKTPMAVLSEPVVLS
jgi:hypothetical protein